MLWAYCTTPYLTMGEYPFRFTYRTKYVILIELNKLSCRTWASTNFRENSKNLQEDFHYDY